MRNNYLLKVTVLFVVFVLTAFESLSIDLAMAASAKTDVTSIAAKAPDEDQYVLNFTKRAFTPQAIEQIGELPSSVYFLQFWDKPENLNQAQECGIKLLGLVSPLTYVVQASAEQLICLGSEKIRWVEAMNPNDKYHDLLNGTLAIHFFSSPLAKEALELGLVELSGAKIINATDHVIFVEATAMQMKLISEWPEVSWISPINNRTIDSIKGACPGSYLTQNNASMVDFSTSSTFKKMASPDWDGPGLGSFTLNLVAFFPPDGFTIDQLKEILDEAGRHWNRYAKINFNDKSSQYIFNNITDLKDPILGVTKLRILGKKIIDAAIFYNDDNGLFTSDISSNNPLLDFTVLHEVGHAVGMNHLDTENSTMYFLQTRINENRAINGLSRSDALQIRAHYEHQSTPFPPFSANFPSQGERVNIQPEFTWLPVISELDFVNFQVEIDTDIEFRNPIKQTVINHNPMSDGLIHFTMSGFLNCDTKYYWRVRAEPNSNSHFDRHSSWTFMDVIDDGGIGFRTFCGFNITKPDSNTTLSTTDDLIIEWDWLYPEFPFDFYLEYKLIGVPIPTIGDIWRSYLYENDGITPIPFIANATGNSVTKTLPLLQTHTYRVRGINNTDHLLSDNSEEFTITGIDEISVQFPNGNEILNAGNDYRITWSYNEPSLFNGPVKVELLKNGSVIDTFTNQTSTNSYNWIVPLNAIDANDYKIRVSGIGANIGISDESDNSFRIKNFGIIINTQCNDGIDNDSDGLIDFGTNPSNDPGCSSAEDTSELDDPDPNPPHPTNLVLGTGGVTSSTVPLQWQGNPSVGIEQYFVYRKNGHSAGGGFTKISEEPATASSQYTYTDNTVAASTDYTYDITSFRSGLESIAASNKLMVTTFAATIPPAATPSSFTATADSTTKIILDWSTNDTENTTGFNLYRLNGNLLYSGNETSFTDSGLNANTNYKYELRAYNSVGVESDSIYANATTNEVTNPTPDSPSGLFITGVGYTSIALQWQDNSSNEDGFKIYRREENDDGPYDYIDYTGANSDNEANYTNTGLNQGIKYYYKVSAFIGGEESAFAGPVSGTTHVIYPPGSFNASTNQNWSIQLTWDHDNDNGEISGYHIYRFKSTIETGCNGTDEDFNYLDSTTSNSYGDNNLLPGYYRYKIVTYLNEVVSQSPPWACGESNN